ncbi:hypothetical protein AB0A77_24275 [Streptomyces varsoviensis]|uniref:hypothetical protein n=1 Tax=Streptomyces varsoviensis TaxID=67373 RepID=UPI0033D7E912
MALRTPTTSAELARLFAAFQAGPSEVDRGPLPVAGSGGPPGFVDQTRRRHDGLPAQHRTLLEPDACPGADAAPLRKSAAGCSTAS